MSDCAKLLRAAITALLTLIAIAGAAVAGLLEDGVVAYDRGDYATALRLLRPLAEKGNADAQYKLGQIYDSGDGATKDTVEAAKWFAEAMKQYRKAAAQGDAKAKEKLGDMYVVGAGVPQDSTEASKWYREAAEQGNGDAAWSLGLLTEALRQEARQDDKSEVQKWILKAAELGQVDAQRDLGRTYTHGYVYEAIAEAAPRAQGNTFGLSRYFTDVQFRKLPPPVGYEGREKDECYYVDQAGTVWVQRPCNQSGIGSHSNEPETDDFGVGSYTNVPPPEDSGVGSYSNVR